MNSAAIRDLIEQVALEEFGPDFKKHMNRFDVESNDNRNLSSGLSARWGSISENLEMVDQKLCVDQEFILDITCRAFVTATDEKAIVKIDSVYDRLGPFLKRAVIDRFDLGNSSTLLKCRLNNVSEPRPFNDQQRDIVKISVNLTVSYVIN